LPYVKDALILGILNYSAFARLVLPEIEKELGRKVRREAIVIATQRYQQRLKGNVKSENLRQLISKTTISLRSDIIDVSLKRNNRTHQIINELMTKVEWEEDDIFFVVQGRHEVELYIDRRTYQEFKKELSKMDTLRTIENLVMIVINEPPGELVTTPGFLHFITGIFALNGINLPQIVSTQSDMILMVDNKDASKGYDLLNDAIAKCRKGMTTQDK